MRFEIELRRVDEKTTVVHCAGPREAVEHVKPGAWATGYSVESVTPIGDDGEYGDSFMVAGCCELCEVVLLDGDDYAVEDEGIQVCRTCCAKEANDAI